MTEQSPQRTALITGASRGLGLALARALADEGWTLIIDARGEEALESARAELSERTRVSRHPRRRFGPRAQGSPGGGGARGRRPGRARQQREHPRPEPAARAARLPARRARGGLQDEHALAPRAHPGTQERTEAGCAHHQRDQRRRRRAVRRLGRLRVEQGRAGTALQHPRGREPEPARLPRRSRRHAHPMHQEAFPDEDISDRPLPEESVPGFLELITGDLPSGRYEARALAAHSPSAREETTHEG